MSDSPVVRAGALVGAAVVALAAIAALTAAVLLAAAAWFCARHPRVAAALAATLIASGTGGPAAAVALWVAGASALLLLRARHRAAFDRYVLRHWRRTFVYGWRWRRAMAANDLAWPGRLGRLRAPRLGTVWSSRWTDELSVRPLDGQDVHAFSARAVALAREFGALSCEVDHDATGAVRLLVRRGDPLGTSPPLPPIPDRPDPTALPLGRSEDGTPWTISLDDGHVLVVGAPMATRCVVWSLLRALAAPVHDGTVEVWAVDGSGGVGLGVASSMFTGTALDPEEATTLVGQLVHGPGRRHRQGGPAVRPLPALLVLHDLGRWALTIDRRVHEELVAALDLALDYGPALGLVVVATATGPPGEMAERFAQRITFAPSSETRADPLGGGTAAIAGAAARVRIHRIDDREMAATAAAFPARSRFGGAPADGALARRVVTSG